MVKGSLSVKSSLRQVGIGKKSICWLQNDLWLASVLMEVHILFSDFARRWQFLLFGCSFLWSLCDSEAMMDGAVFSTGSHIHFGFNRFRGRKLYSMGSVSLSPSFFLSLSTRYDLLWSKMIVINAWKVDHSDVDLKLTFS